MSQPFSKPVKTWRIQYQPKEPMVCECEAATEKEARKLMAAQKPDWHILTIAEVPHLKNVNNE